MLITRGYISVYIAMCVWVVIYPVLWPGKLPSVHPVFGGCPMKKLNFPAGSKSIIYSRLSRDRKSLAYENRIDTVLSLVELLTFKWIDTKWLWRPLVQNCWLENQNERFDDVPSCKPPEFFRRIPPQKSMTRRIYMMGSTYWMFISWEVCILLIGPVAHLHLYKAIVCLIDCEAWFGSCVFTFT